MNKSGLILITVFALSCKSGFIYETDTKYNKSYIGKYDVIATNFSDSILVTGKTFEKKKNSLETIYSKLYFIDKNNDTALISNTGNSGYRITISAGKYKCILKSNRHHHLIIDSLNFMKGNYYSIDFYLQKGKGIDSWCSD